MTFNDILKESWLSISGNKIRSFLTVLGIVIGVMAVVIMVAVGETVSKQINDQFSSLGTNTIMIRAGAAQSAGVRTGNRQTLTIQDSEFIAQLPDVAAASPDSASSAANPAGVSEQPAVKQVKSRIKRTDAASAPELELFASEEGRKP